MGRRTHRPRLAILAESRPNNQSRFPPDAFLLDLINPDPPIGSAMILDFLSSASHYYRLHAHFPRAFDFLQAFDPATPDGKIEIDGPQLVAIVQRYETAPEQDKSWEAHRLHGDIQYVVSGREKMLYAPARDLVSSGPYNEAKDVEKFTGDSLAHSVPLVVPAGGFCIFLPQDGHKPGCMVAGPEPVLKVVIKFRLAF